MKYVQLICFFLCAAFIGCNRNSEELGVHFHEDGREKPVVALVPFFDRSEADMPWSLSEELTASLHQRFFKRGNFFVAPSEQVNRSIVKLDSRHNPFGRDVEWVGEAFKGNEFVIFVELIDHHIHPKPHKNIFVDKITPSCELNITVRIKVFDLRNETPTVILQEIVRQSHLIPKPSAEIEGKKDKWKRKTYIVSPMGFAHLQLTKEIADRVEDYILLSKSKH